MTTPIPSQDSDFAFIDESRENWLKTNAKALQIDRFAHSASQSLRFSTDYRTLRKLADFRATH